jgi:hypothetical protein
MPPGLTTPSASLFMSRYFFSAGITCSRSRVIFAGSRMTVSNFSPLFAASRSHGKMSAWTKRTCALLSWAFCLAIFEHLPRRDRPDHFAGAAMRARTPRSRRSCSTGRARACLGENRRGACGCRAGRRRSRSCAPPGRHAELQTVLVDRHRRRRARHRCSRSSPAWPRAPRRTSRTGEPGKCSRRHAADHVALLPHAGREVLDDQQCRRSDRPPVPLKPSPSECTTR